MSPGPAHPAFAAPPRQTQHGGKHPSKRPPQVTQSGADPARVSIHSALSFHTSICVIRPWRTT